ncbi:MAG: glycosyltransferase family 39 protein [Candidatus Shapirobacteria bacterium]|jgi:hypothetical protein|nr:glycosyltransferase family 39 protein [Candidatus Shapirobacteria bacterium]
MQFNKIKNFLIPLSLLVLMLATRFCFLNWGNGFFFNPDENNMAASIAQMSYSNLNPDFFAYGQFPLFLTFFTTPNYNFSTIILTLRFWSAIFSCLSLFFFYLISKNIFKSPKVSFIFVLLLIFTPGLIQLAHFGTTESLLIFVFSANIFLSLKYYQNQQKKYFLFSVLISAIGLSSKITAIFFILPFYFSLFFIFLENKKILNFISTTLIFTFFFLSLSILFSPFNIIDFSNFKSTMIHETSIATGQLKIFYTHQFENSYAYLFQFKNIFPYTNGIFIFTLSFFGFFIFLKNKIRKELLLVFLPSIIYFLYVGQLFVKWTRFVSPLFFIGPFFCLFIFKKFKNVFLTFILIILMISPGIYFFQKYFLPDNRITASNWINSNIPLNSYILSESGNVINLPLFSSKFTVNNFDFYNPENLSNLSAEINKSDYIIVPSRRVFKNNFSLTQNYYQQLFSGEIGFNEIKKFNNQKSLFLNSENAEETWSVFDHPTIRIYQHVK